MLVNLAIRDFTIVDRLELDLDAGLTALTGETGAGKSILVDALVLVLGGRASADAVRPGRSRAEITAIFDPTLTPALGERLKALDLDTEDGECIVRRVIESEGRSRAFVNGRPVPAQTLRELGQGVIEIHGQHAHHSLMRPESQRALLDTLGGHGDALEAVRAAHEEMGALVARRNELLSAFDDREARADYVGYQLEELDALALEAGEPERLALEQRRLVNAGEMAASCAALEALLGDESHDAPSGKLREGLVLAQSLGEFENGFDEVARCLSNALIELEEAGRAMRGHAEAFEPSPARLAEVEHRLTRLHDLGRKHRVAAEELPERAEQLRAELEQLVDAEAEITRIDAEIAKAETRYDEAASRLRDLRERSGPSLAERVSSLLADLGMPKARFSVRITPLAATENGPQRSAHGADRIEFWVQTNSGHQPAPLARIASGGELSRISLALHVAGAATAGAATLVFDEVDVGIGGSVASQIGHRLRQVGNDKQVLCITHLPQVAAHADHHLRVVKHQSARTTTTALEAIEGSERVEEIARMLGGMTITSRTLEHAREMLALENTA